MEMVDAYVSEIGRRLPARQRADIEQEIRSMIGDTLEDESRTQDRPVDEEMAVTVLKRLGPPEKMAASYQPPQYLIGPELYPFYIQVVKIVMSVLLVMGIVGLALSVGLSGTLQNQVLRPLAEASGGILTSIFQAFGIITLVFAILQRVTPIHKLVRDEAEFDPRKLKLEPDADKISPPGLGVELALTFIAISIFALFPQIVGVGSFQSGRWVIVPVLSQAFFGYLPYMIALWAAEGLLKVALLAMGRWTLTTHWVQVGLNILSIVFLAIILKGPSLVALPPDIVARLGWGTAAPNFVSNISGWIDGGIKIGLLVALVVEAIETVITGVKLVLRARLVTASE
jgi:hypothetical protein